jgi:hypothetical protein
MGKSASNNQLPNSTSGNLVPLALLPVLVICGCESSYRDETKTKPETAALVGTWIPDEESVKYMREVGGYDVSNKTELVLEANNTYTMRNMPDWLWLDDGRSHKTLRFEKGTWEIMLDGARQYWIVLLRSEVRSRGSALYGQHPPYRLRFSFGSVDENPQNLTFVKE